MRAKVIVFRESPSALSIDVDADWNVETTAKQTAGQVNVSSRDDDSSKLTRAASESSVPNSAGRRFTEEVAQLRLAAAYVNIQERRIGSFDRTPVLSGIVVTA